MDDFLWSLVPWGTEFVLQVQSWRSGPLDAIFLLFTAAGSEFFYLAFWPFLYWCVHKRLGVAATCLYLGSTYLNDALKNLYAIPRPFVLDRRVVPVYREPSFSFPSGHAQSAVVTWGYLARRVGRPLAWAIALALMLCIGFSRIYLGVHFPQDVVGGFLVGAVLLLAFTWAESRLRGRLIPSLAIRLGLTAVLPLLLAALHHTDDATGAMGTLLGFGIGCQLEEVLVQSSPGGAWWKLLARYLLGMAVTVGLWAGLKVILPAGVPFRLLRYALVGLWVSLVAPWAFVKAEIMERVS
jgi:membrane-associated phospholipid phosphatase